MNREFQSGGIILLSLAVIFQFLLEVSVGRALVAPNILSLVLVYLTINKGTCWSIDGAFWAGICLDLLLHQPPGASSLGLICGLYIAKRIAGASAGENRIMLLILTAIASVVSDSIFIIAAVRPFGAITGSGILIVLPRMLLTMGFGLLILLLGLLFSSTRQKRYES